MLKWIDSYIFHLVNRRPDVVGQQSGLFERGEMSAGLHLCDSDQFFKFTIQKCLQCQRYRHLVRENSTGCWNLNIGPVCVYNTKWKFWKYCLIFTKRILHTVQWCIYVHYVRKSSIFFTGVLRVQAHRRGHRTSDPVYHDVVQQFVCVELGQATVRYIFVIRGCPGGKLFQDVSCQADRRIVQSDSFMHIYISRDLVKF